MFESVEGEFVEEIAGEVDFEGPLEMEDGLFGVLGVHVGDFFHQLVEGCRLFSYVGGHSVPVVFGLAKAVPISFYSAKSCTNFEKCVPLSDLG